MDKREEGLIELKARFEADKDGANTLGLQQFRRSPTSSLDNPPILIMLEDEDNIIKYLSRNDTGYPCRRELEVMFELIVSEETHNIRELIRVVRTIAFTGGIKLADTTSIREIKVVGPFGYGVPKMLGMRLILGMRYTDNGN